MDATLASNGGHDSLVLSIDSRFDWQGEPGVEASLAITSQNWDGDHEHPVRVLVAGLCLGISAVRALHDVLAVWVSLPLHELATTKLAGTHALALAPGQRLDFVFGDRPDTIADRKPTVTIAFETTRLKGEHHFVTDPSCLREFADTLVAALLEIHTNAGRT
jgi:hypothetical protein